jgi:hypothetical protein
MRFYQRTPTNTYLEILPDAQGVIRSVILAGFQFRLSDLYRLPTLETLALDPVYQGYILPNYRAALTEAEEARQRIAAEVIGRQLAEAQAAAEIAARQAIEAENARLREELTRLRQGTSSSTQ